MSLDKTNLRKNVQSDLWGKTYWKQEPEKLKFVGEISSVKGVNLSLTMYPITCILEQDVEETRNTIIHVANSFSLQHSSMNVAKTISTLANDFFHSRTAH